MSRNTYPTITNSIQHGFECSGRNARNIPKICGYYGRACCCMNSKADRANCAGCPLAEYAREHETAEVEQINAVIESEEKKTKTLSGLQLIELYFAEYPFSRTTQDALEYLGAIGLALLEEFVMERVDLKDITEEKLSLCSFGMKELYEAYPGSWR